MNSSLSEIVYLVKLYDVDKNTESFEEFRTRCDEFSTSIKNFFLQDH